MKPSAGTVYYDQKDIYDRYLEHRQKIDNPNLVIERPIIRELIGEAADLDVLDLGCGYGEMGEYLLKNAINSYHGIDPSQRMIAAARERLKGDQLTLEVESIDSFQWQTGTYDLVISRMVFHYLPQIEVVLHNCYEALKPGGRLIISVEHPVMTSMMGLQEQQVKKTSCTVGKYFESGPRHHHWMGGAVIKYHRSIEEYFMLIQQQGFLLTDLREGQAEEQYFTEKSAFERRKNLPRYLILKAVK